MIRKISSHSQSNFCGGGGGGGSGGGWGDDGSDKGRRCRCWSVGPQSGVLKRRESRWRAVSSRHSSMPSLLWPTTCPCVKFSYQTHHPFLLWPRKQSRQNQGFYFGVTVAMETMQGLLRLATLVWQLLTEARAQWILESRCWSSGSSGWSLRLYKHFSPTCELARWGQVTVKVAENALAAQSIAYQYLLHNYWVEKINKTICILGSGKSLVTPEKPLMQ